MSGRRLGFLGVVVLAWVTHALLPAGARAQASSSGLIRVEEAASHGLVRAWAEQVTLNRQRDALESLTLSNGMLLAQSLEGLVHALDAETGSTRWSIRVGDRRYPTMPPGTNGQYVAVTNGDRLYMLEAKLGHTVWERRLDFMPSGPLALDDKRVYVPLMNGTLKAYRLDLHELAAVEDPIQKAEAVLEAIPHTYRAKGEPTTRPLIVGEQLAWTTLNGRLYVGKRGEPGTNWEYRLTEACHSAPTYRPPLLYLTSGDRSVYAMDEERGRERWRFYTGSPIRESAWVVGDSLVVPTRMAGVYCLEATTGKLRWSNPRGTRFVAGSPDRVYLTDELEQLVILDRTSGRLTDEMPLRGLPIRLGNGENDRLYLARPSGLVQCLHETGLAAAVAVAPPPTEEELATEKKGPSGLVRDKPLDRKEREATTEDAAEAPAEDAPAGDAPSEDPPAEAPPAEAPPAEAPPGEGQ